MDESATHRDAGARRVRLNRISAEAIEPERRAEALAFEVADRLAGASVDAAPSAEPFFDIGAIDLGAQVPYGFGRLKGVAIDRTPRHLGDGQDSFFLMISRGGDLRAEQGERRILLKPGEGVLIDHARPGRLDGRDARFECLLLPRRAFSGLGRIEDLCGVTRSPTDLALLRAYAAATMEQTIAGVAPPIVGRHLLEITAAAFQGALAPRPTGEALRAARLAAMRETIARRFAEPTFGVRHLARAHGVSERTCQMLFAAAGSSVTDEIASIRLDRARERLKTETGARIVDIAYGVGFSDLSHFNRRFRARFGVSPGDARSGG